MYIEHGKDIIEKFGPAEAKGAYMMLSMLGGEPEDRVALWALDNMDRETLNITADINKAAEDTLLDEEAVKDAIARLEKGGFIFKGESGEYRIRFIQDFCSDVLGDTRTVVGELTEGMRACIARRIEDALHNELRVWHKALSGKIFGNEPGAVIKEASVPATDEPVEDSGDFIILNGAEAGWPVSGGDDIA